MVNHVIEGGEMDTPQARPPMRETRKDEVREALVRVLGQAHSPEYRALLDALGIRGIAAPEFVADALLRATPPAAETGEQGVWVNGQLSTLAAPAPREVSEAMVRDALAACDELASYEDALHEDGFTLFPTVMMRCLQTIRAALSAETGTK